MKKLLPITLLLLSYFFIYGNLNIDDISPAADPSTYQVKIEHIKMRPNAKSILYEIKVDGQQRNVLYKFLTKSKLQIKISNGRKVFYDGVYTKGGQHSIRQKTKDPLASLLLDLDLISADFVGFKALKMRMLNSNMVWGMEIYTSFFDIPGGGTGIPSPPIIELPCIDTQLECTAQNDDGSSSKINCECECAQAVCTTTSTTITKVSFTVYEYEGELQVMEHHTTETTNTPQCTCIAMPGAKTAINLMGG